MNYFKLFLKVYPYAYKHAACGFIDNDDTDGEGWWWLAMKGDLM
jgi:hypothetical protein